MIEDDIEGIPSGGVFILDNVYEFNEKNSSKLNFVKEPIEIPLGRYAFFNDPNGNPFRFINITKE